MSTYLCGLDIGGTFTDCVLVDDGGRVVSAKAPSTPGDFAEGLMNALGAAARKCGRPVPDLLANTSLISHGTTVGTNAIVQKRGARIGLVTTRGHNDVIHIMRGSRGLDGREVRKVVHIPESRKPTPIVPKRLIRGVSERVDCFGAVVVPLNEGQAEEAIRELLAEDVEAIAICFLWSFLEPAHERRARDIVRDLAPGLFVTCSHELVPKWGEYERTTASCLNAYVGPVTTSYLADIEERLGMDVDACAAGISQIVEFQMADLIHKATIQKGFDPRDFVVFAFGGAGPAHAGVFATELGVSKVVIPQRATASVWCAFGAASVDLLHIYERVDIMASPFDLERVNALLASLRGQAEAQLLADGMPRERHRFRYALDMRHKGQIHEVEVGLDEMPVGGPEFDGLPERFTALYERLYGSGSSLSGARLEIVTARCRASAATRKPSFVRHEELTPDIPPEARLARRSVYWPRIAGAGAGTGTGNGTAPAAAAAGGALPGRVDTPVYDGHRLVPGNGLEGPAIVELDTTTVVVHPGQALRMDAYGNFELFPGPARPGGGAVEHRAERPAAAGATVAAG